MKVIFIISLIVLGIVSIFTVDYYFGKRNKRKINIPSPYITTRHSDLELFVNGPDLFTNLFADINNAKKHIHILFYIVKDDEISKEFLEILIKKAHEGVEVLLLLDWLGSRKVSRQLLNQLKNAGGNYSYCHTPHLPYLFYSLQVRNHRKISVIDGKIGYLGGFNIGKEYINKKPPLSPWRDYHLKIVGEGVYDLQMQFLVDWRNTTGNDLLSEKRYFPQLEKGPIEHQIAPSEGISLEESYLNLISKAEYSIFIGTPYFIPSKKILRKLINRLQDGISVTVLVPFRSDHLFVKEASYPYIRELLKAGANVYEYVNGFYHAKVMLIDNKICNIGTANFDRRSLFINYELNCYIHDENFINEVISVIKTDIANSERLTLIKATNKNVFEKINEAIATIIAPFL